MFEVGRETDRPGRAGIDAQTAEHARPQIVLVEHQPLAALARFGIGDHFGRDADGAVGTRRLAQAAGDTLVPALGVVRHGQFAAEAVEHPERGAVLRILLGDLGREKFAARHLESRQQGTQSVKESFDIAFHG